MYSSHDLIRSITYTDSLYLFFMIYNVSSIATLIKTRWSHLRSSRTRVEVVSSDIPPVDVVVILFNRRLGSMEFLQAHEKKNLEKGRTPI